MLPEENNLNIPIDIGDCIYLNQKTDLNFIKMPRASNQPYNENSETSNFGSICNQNPGLIIF